MSDLPKTRHLCYPLSSLGNIAGMGSAVSELDDKSAVNCQLLSMTKTSWSSPVMSMHKNRPVGSQAWTRTGQLVVKHGLGWDGTSAGPTPDCWTIYYCQGKRKSLPLVAYPVSGEPIRHEIVSTQWSHRWPWLI